MSAIASMSDREYRSYRLGVLRERLGHAERLRPDDPDIAWEIRGWYAGEYMWLALWFVETAS